MLKGLKSLLGRVGLAEASLVTDHVSAQQDVSGYHLPQSVASLTASPARQIYLQQLWDNCVLPMEQYHQLYYEPLAQLLSRVQNVPAASSGPWSGSGGYGDMMVKFVTCAVRLAKAHLLPPGAAPEEQSAQNALWNAVVFWSALFYHLPLLSQLEGELRNGQPWLPGMDVPDGPYRFRFSRTQLSAGQIQSAATVIACQLLPLRATGWLSMTPAILHCLTQRLCGLPSTLAVIDELLLTAVDKSGAALPLPTSTTSMPLFTAPNLSFPQFATAKTSMEDSEVCQLELTTTLETAFTPMAEGEAVSTALLTDDMQKSDEDTLALLSLLGAVEPTVTDSAAVSEVSIITETNCPPVNDIGNANSALNEKLNPEISLPERDIDVPVETIPRFARCAINGLMENKVITEEGEAFWRWLTERLRQGKMPVNHPEDKLHLVAGFLFMPVPGIFFQYLKESERPMEDRKRVQEGFERLNRHKRRDKQRFYFARLYPSGEGKGSFTRAKGYLVRASLLFYEVPQDSRYLIIS